MKSNFDRNQRRNRKRRLAKKALILSDRRHNYFEKLESLSKEMLAKGDLAPGLQDVDICHDEWCALLTRGDFCDCDPEIRLRE